MGTHNRTEEGNSLIGSIKCFGNKLSLLLVECFSIESDPYKCQAGKSITPCVADFVWIFNNKQIGHSTALIIMVYCKFSYNWFEVGLLFFFLTV